MGSALTVIVASACMGLAELGLFSTTGPAIAMSVAVTLALSLTAAARADRAASRGAACSSLQPVRSSGRLGAGLPVRGGREPARVLVAGLAPLLLARRLLSDAGAELRRARRAARRRPRATAATTWWRRHYPDNEVLADFVLISADHDLRNAHDLAALEQAAASAARVPGRRLVRAVTSPLGAADRPGLAGLPDRPGRRPARDASGRLAAGQAPAQRLADGRRRAHDRRTETWPKAPTSAVTGAGSLVDGARSLQGGALPAGGRQRRRRRRQPTAAGRGAGPRRRSRRWPTTRPSSRSTGSDWRTTR